MEPGRHAPGAPRDRGRLDALSADRPGPEPAERRLIERFADAFGEAGGSCHVVADGGEAAAVVERIVRAARATRSSRSTRTSRSAHLPAPSVLYTPSELLQSSRVEAGLRQLGIRLDAVGEVDRPEDYAVGLTGVRWAVAETGSLVIGGRRERRGGWGVASVLPRVHVAVLRASDIHPDLAAAHERLVRHMAAGETEWVWISGPSSTADIAKTLVHGIHGPNELHAVILAEGQGARAGAATTAGQAGREG